MKLELKHLAAYLPYGLQIVYLPKTIEPSNLRREVITLGLYFVRCGENPLATYHFHEIKLVLRPMIECEKYLNEESGIELDSSYLSYNESCNSINIYPDGSGWTHSVDVYKNIYEWLFERHFDIFGLIPAGLAIDKTLNP